jgi:3'-5' exoribonuclease
MEDIHIRALLKSIFSDSEIRNRYKHAPAAKAMHHPYLGGLVEHVLSICSLVDVIAPHYTKEYETPVHKDLLMAGAILHDIGKIYELEYSRSFGYTDAGKLIGHITIGVELVDGKIRQLDSFPDDLAMHLKHLLLSHHTLLEFGSPKRPKTLEAVLLGFLDDMDAKVNSVMSIMEATPEEQNWSPYQRMFERAIYTARPTVTREAAGETPSGETPSSEKADENSTEKAGAKTEAKAESQSDSSSSPSPQKEDLDLFS